jgi:glutamate/tyrosine decarboxylase-like PLP-dependent enzyme
VRALDSDARFRLEPRSLMQAVERDRAAGLRPGFVIATAGTTNTGTVDPLDELADLCAAEDLWLHVDGAYGAPAVICEAHPASLDAIARADSVVLDPHKWLFQPYDIGCLLVREAGALGRAFAMAPAYLTSASTGHGEVDFRDRSLELSRRSRALKLWLSFRIYGVGRFRAAIARGIELAEYAERLLCEGEHWEVVTPAQLGIVTFALRGVSASEQAARADALTRDGFATLTSTMLGGKSVLRLCTINPLTSEQDIAATLSRLEKAPTSP